MRTLSISLLGAIALSAPLAAQGAQSVPFTAATWIATDSVRFESWLGQSAVYINRGVALADVNFVNGTIDFDIAATDKSNNMGIAFRARDVNHYEALFFRPGSSGTPDAIQYAPGLNSLAVAWQVYHGDDANASALVPRGKWMHVQLRVHADTMELFLDRASTATLMVPHLALGRDGGGKIGLWAGGFGQGVYVANLTYTTDAAPHPVAADVLPPGTIADWQLSQMFDASTQVPGTLPTMTAMQWESVHAESPGLVLINRYRAAPTKLPSANADTVLTGTVPGSKVVYARTVINATHAELRRVQVGFSDGIVVYCNGVPLYSGMHSAYYRGGDLGYMNLLGDAVYLPLKAGRNEIVVAVTEYFGGWAFSMRAK